MSDKIHNVSMPEEGKRTSPFADAPTEVGSGETCCWYNGEKYSNGSIICQVGQMFQCSYGVWINQHQPCNSDEE